MLKVYVCEDNKVQRENMSTFITSVIEREQLEMRLEYSTGDPLELLEKIKEQREPAVYFLDVDLGAEIDGFQLACELRKKQSRCFIIFVTTHSEMAYMTFSYKLEAMDFIYKDDITKVKERVYQCLLEAEQLNKRLGQEDEKLCYALRVGTKVRMIPFDTILYFKSTKNGKKVTMYAENCQIEFSDNLKNLGKKLGKYFLRCHHCCLVNVEKIVEVRYKEGYVLMEDGQQCPVSVRMGKKLKERLK